MWVLAMGRGVFGGVDGRRGVVETKQNETRDKVYARSPAIEDGVARGSDT
jgi:hypothetical protein